MKEFLRIYFYGLDVPTGIRFHYPPRVAHEKLYTVNLLSSALKKTMRQITFPLAWKVAEFVFIGFFVLTLPLWFPPLMLFVLLDPPYHFALWSVRLRSSDQKYVDLSDLAQEEA